MAFSWRSQLSVNVSPFLIILVWIVMSTSGIFLFMLAIKKAHRLMIDEERSLKEKQDNADERPSRKKDAGKDNQSLDFAATARKMVRRVSEDSSMEELSEELLKNLARELEIMSGVFYIRKRIILKPSLHMQLIPQKGLTPSRREKDLLDRYP